MNCALCAIDRNNRSRPGRSNAQNRCKAKSVIAATQVMYISKCNFAYNDSIDDYFKVSLERKDRRAIAVSGANTDPKEAEDRPVTGIQHFF